MSHFPPNPPHRLRLCLALAIVACCALARGAAAQDRGWEHQPYRIRALLAIDAPGGLTPQLADQLPRYLKRRVHAAVGPLWSFDLELATGALRYRVFSEIAAPAEQPPDKFAAEGDKLLLLAIRSQPEGIELTAREYDRYVARWGMPIRTECRQPQALAEQLFATAWQAVAPLLQFELDPNDDRRVLVVPRGAALMRHASRAAMLKPGDIFLPVLRRTTRLGEVVEGGIQVVPWTYLEIVANDGGPTAARIHSGNRRPFGVRRQGRVEQLAIALRAEPAETTVRLHSRTNPDKPLVGYQVFAQPVAGVSDPGSSAAENDSVSLIGTTDRRGQLPIPPGESRVRMLYLKNGGQVLARLPIVPGAQPTLDVPLPDDDPRLAAEARLAALREELIDVVARRNILMARARQKIEQEDFQAAQALLADADQLPGRSQFNLTLTTAARTLRSDDPQIQRRIDQLFEATQTVMNQYLDLRPLNKLHDELRAAQRKET